MTISRHIGSCDPPTVRATSCPPEGDAQHCLPEPLSLFWRIPHGSESLTAVPVLRVACGCNHRHSVLFVAMSWIEKAGRGYARCGELVRGGNTSSHPENSVFMLVVPAGCIEGFDRKICCTGGGVRLHTFMVPLQPCSLVEFAGVGHRGFLQRHCHRRQVYGHAAVLGTHPGSLTTVLRRSLSASELVNVYVSELLPPLAVCSPQIAGSLWLGMNGQHSQVWGHLWPEW